MTRHVLPLRRLCHTISFEHGLVKPQKYHMTVGFNAKHVPMELFLNSSQKSGSEADINSSDAAIAVSLALQYGCPLEVLCGAMRRNPDGAPMGPIGCALDLMVELMQQISKEEL